jgi:2-polyprenyl-6-methoxyphenol hydroxylase-like FAD-dependent oxidoreductase
MREERSVAVVIGASVTGLLAAAALSEAFGQVTVYERDALPAEPAHRRGVPQDRQLHAVHGRGVQAMDELLPGLSDELIAAGAVTGDAQLDIHWYLDDYHLKPARSGLSGLGVSRLLLEWHIRSRVAALPNVTITGATDVAGLAVRGRQVACVRIRAARTQGAAEETVPADVVVDASGRGSRASSWLAELSLPVPRTSRVRVGLTYVTRSYTKLPGQLGGRRGALTTPYPGMSRTGAVLQQEGDRFTIMLGGMVGTEPPLDEAGMLAFAESLASPDLASVMRESEPLSDPVKYTYPESAWHHYEKLSAYLGGFLVAGDAYSTFNPIYGQGITIAALEAMTLRGLLRAAAGEPAELERRYFRAAGKLVAEAWQTSATNDLRFPEVPGKLSLADRLVGVYVSRYRAAASVDPVLGQAFLRVANMIDKPVKLLAPGHVVRVFRSAGKGVRAPRA